MNAPEPTGAAAGLVIVRLGAVVSVRPLDAARLPLPRPSCTASAAIDTVAVPPDAGVTSTCQRLEPDAVWKPDLVPPVTVTSESVKSETASLNWKKTVKTPAPPVEEAVWEITTSGRVESAAMLKLALALEFFKASSAAPLETSTDTVPPWVGVTSACHRFEPVAVAKLASVPLDTETSAAAKPVTASLNWKKTWNEAAPTGAEAGLEITSDGGVESAWIENCAARLSLPAESIAAPASTETDTVPPALGVRSASHRLVSKAVWKLVRAPLDTETSAAAKPETASLNWKKTLNEAEPTGEEDVLVITRDGLVVSASMLNVADSLPLSSVSWAALLPTETVTVPPVRGTILACHWFCPEAVWKPERLPLITATSDESKPDTCSLNWKRT